MRTPVRLLLLTAIPLVLVSTGIMLLPDNRGTQGTAVGHWLREMQRGEHLDASTLDLMRSTERTREILLDLAEGNLTLPEAAEQLRRERESRPSPFNVEPIPDEGETLTEYYLRSTVEQVEGVLKGHPGQQQVVHRLQHEMCDCLGKRAESPATELARSPETAEPDASTPEETSAPLLSE